MGIFQLVSGVLLGGAVAIGGVVVYNKVNANTLSPVISKRFVNADVAARKMVMEDLRFDNLSKEEREEEIKEAKKEMGMTDMGKPMIIEPGARRNFLFNDEQVLVLIDDKRSELDFKANPQKDDIAKAPSASKVRKFLEKKYRSGELTEVEAALYSAVVGVELMENYKSFDLPKKTEAQ